MIRSVMPARNQMRVIALLSVVALLGAIAWLVAEPGYESAIAVVVSLIAVLGLCDAEKKRADKAQSQNVEKDGFGIQAAGDVKIGGDIKIKK